MEAPDQENPCAICLGGMAAGGGQATFTAECSHTFHFNCISASVAHGHLVCPLCNARWRELPFLRPTAPVPQPQPRTLPRLGRPVPMHAVQPPSEPIASPPLMHGGMPPFPAQVPLPPHGHIMQHHQPPPPPPDAQIMQHHQPPPVHTVQHHQPPPEPAVVFDDDEQVEPASGQPADSTPAAASNGAVVVKTHAEYSAVARDSSSDNFAVLVHVKAPSMANTVAAGSDKPPPRAPLDLVTVLDVSGSMSGHKLALLKQAMRFVIDNLGPDDRLSIVSFSSEARRLTRLTRMSDAGKALAVSAVESLVARGGTNIAEGLRTAAKVLDERRHRNAVSSVVLLSDGQDTYTMMRRRGSSGVQTNNYEELVPPSFARTGADGEWSAPIHTFGFGNDHDAAAMHVIAEATGGTFSFIEKEAVIQDAFAQCIGGLLSVVVQEARIAVSCVHPGVRVVSVKSGRYESRVDEDGRAASVRVGELYADEERRFLLFLAVPRAEATDGDTTALVKVVFSYRNAATGAEVSVTAEDTAVARPEHAPSASERSVEVERERIRVEAAEDIAAARAAAERGEHQEAVEILENRQRALEQSEAAGDGDPMIMALGAELQEMRERVSDRQSYMRSGRAYMLAGMSAHQQQRATSRQMLEPEEQQTLMRARNGGPRRMIRRGVGSIAGGYRAAAPVAEASNEATMSYATPAMRAMLLRSRVARGASTEQGQQEEQPPMAGEEDAGSSEVKIQAPKET
ncbi:E3 ubiquitin-protein ligase WAV3-like [Triticum dicoccoides]|uniref:E3 ubiquitin-protein ligase WAV3-like n=1 Tax=Triticum dicoccoides TaxID=85692 RepID=UPI00188ED7AF|nr:E3 ubiquitin-protein ligase WAV3-like [Triticum dicoccoides]